MPPLKQSLAADPQWSPLPGDFTWTRIDKSTTRALGMIIRLPPDESSRQINKDNIQNVYCDQDGTDRYSIACLTRHGDQDSHVYAPRHYMKLFDLNNALNLKCMKTKPRDVRDLTPWDRDKRHSIKVVQKWLENKESNSLDSVHHFVECPECCDEACDEFWLAVKLVRGDAHIKRRESLEKRRQMIKKECQERDQLLRDRQLKASAKGDAAAQGSAGSGDEGEEEDSSTDESGNDDSSDDPAQDDEDDEDDDVSDRESSFEEDAASEDDDDENASSGSSGAAPSAAASTRSPTTKQTKKSPSAKSARSSTPSGKKRRTNPKKYFLASPSSSEGTEAEDGGGGGGLPVSNTNSGEKDEPQSSSSAKKNN